MVTIAIGYDTSVSEVVLTRGRLITSRRSLVTCLVRVGEGMVPLLVLKVFLRLRVVYAVPVVVVLLT